VAIRDDAELTRYLKQLALSDDLAIDLVGIAPAERLEAAPAGIRPSDYLSSANSVISLAGKIPDGTIEVAACSKTLGPYMWYGYAVLNRDLSRAASRLTRFLETQGFKALPFEPEDLDSAAGARALFSHRHAAVAAGLGDIGLSGLLLTPEFGPRQRLVSVVTDAPLQSSRMYEGAPTVPSGVLCPRMSCSLPLISILR
jgi:epoxyqueuosine reductase